MIYNVNKLPDNRSKIIAGIVILVVFGWLIYINYQAILKSSQNYNDETVLTKNKYVAEMFDNYRESTNQYPNRVYPYREGRFLPTQQYFSSRSNYSFPRGDYHPFRNSNPTYHPHTRSINGPIGCPGFESSIPSRFSSRSFPL